MTVKDFVESLAAEIGGNTPRAEPNISAPMPQQDPTALEHFPSDSRLEVIGSDGLHVGVVEHVQGDWIVLQTPSASVHRRLAKKFVVVTETQKLQLSITSSEARAKIGE
ncbi:DUF2171 domain-containing protein [Tardiphaga sp.]|uniref:DUF2171 domain-containing protein n=1 Tax=Tardiphaga sp. TaxID=1926292 RepID=UPI0037D9EE39